MKCIRKDIVIIGAGFAGIGAAIAAARSGNEVCLIEVSSRLGGVAGDCPGMPIGAAFPAGFCVGGIVEELIQRLTNYSPPMAVIRDCALIEFGPEVFYDYEVLQKTLYEMLIESKVDLLMETSFKEILLTDNRIEGIFVENKNEKYCIIGSEFIDCTGDGELSKQAGVPYTLGDEAGRMMGASLIFTLDRVDWAKVEVMTDDPYFREYAKQGIDLGLIHEDLSKLYIIKGFYSDEAFFNSVIIGDVDGTNSESVAKANVEARKRAFELIQYIRLIPGFENARLRNMGTKVGIRETRKFDALYNLKGFDLSSGTKFNDGIVACDNPVDDVFRGSNEMTHDAIIGKGDYYTIPFRIMVPQKVENLLFAGRLVSADSVAFASIRGMSQCMIMGQASGIGAVYANENNVPVQLINTDKVIKTLIQNKVNGLKVL